MRYFWDTVETIPEGCGFKIFSPYHLMWLAGFVLVTVLLSIIYRQCSEDRRKKLRVAIAVLLVLDELFKIIGLAAFDRYLPKYLPLHLCSINIILIALHAFKPSKTLDNFLYLVCIPGAIAALLFPSWTPLPPANFMHLHSATVHVLLALYPIMLTAGGDIVPQVRYLPKCLLLLFGMAIPIYGVNLLFDTNFMFLMEAESGNPLSWFEHAFGNHLIGFPVLLTLVAFVMYAPLYLCHARGHRK